MKNLRAAKRLNGERKEKEQEAQGNAFSVFFFNSFKLGHSSSEADETRIIIMSRALKTQVRNSG